MSHTQWTLDHRVSTRSGLPLQRCKSPSDGPQSPEPATQFIPAWVRRRQQGSHAGHIHTAEVTFQPDSCLHHCSLPVTGKEREAP